MRDFTKNDIRLFIALCSLGLVAPILFPAYINQLSFAWIFVVIALSWDMQGGHMGYNSFGNIVFFGVGMYAAASFQILPFFSLGDWTEAGGVQTFEHSVSQYFSGYALGILFAAIAAVATAFIFGNLILKMRGHYFAICTLALGVAIGEVFASIEILGAGQGLSLAVWPRGFLDDTYRRLFFYYQGFLLFVLCFLSISYIIRTRFGMTLNAIRDGEDKAESMGLNTNFYKISSWILSAFFIGLCGALVGHLVGFIDPIDVAFSGATYGIWMIIMAIIGGKGRLWGPVIGALFFHAFNEIFWTYFLGWQRVALGLIIVIIVVFFPEGILGFFQVRKKSSVSALSTQPQQQKK